MFLFFDLDISSDEIRNFTDTQNNATTVCMYTTHQPSIAPFNAASGTLLFGVGRADIAEILSALVPEAQARNLREKTEFHITIVGYKNGQTILKALEKLSEQERSDSEKKIAESIKTIDWTYSTSAQKAFFIEKEYPAKKDGEGTAEHRHAIIHMVYMPGIAVFYEKLNGLLGTDLSVPPAHITLFTHSSDPNKGDEGIGIESSGALGGLRPQVIEL